MNDSAVCCTWRVRILVMIIMNWCFWMIYSTVTFSMSLISGVSVEWILLSSLVLGWAYQSLMLSGNLFYNCIFLINCGIALWRYCLSTINSSKLSASHLQFIAFDIALVHSYHITVVINYQYGYIHKFIFCNLSVTDLFKYILN